MEEEDESVSEAEQRNLTLFPHLGAGVMLRLFAESEHLSFASLPQTCQPLLPTDKLFSHMNSGQNPENPIWKLSGVVQETAHVRHVHTYWKYSVWFR